jgi:hypothetical protein
MFAPRPAVNGPTVDAPVARFADDTSPPFATPWRRAGYSDEVTRNATPVISDDMDRQLASRYSRVGCVNRVRKCHENTRLFGFR